MYKPLPIKLVERYTEWASRPVLMIGLFVAVPSLLFYIATGAIYPDDVQPWVEDPLAMTGLFLMLSFLPAYIAMCFVVTTRLNRRTHQELKSLLPADVDIDALAYRWGRGWIYALALALIYGYGFNIGWFSLSFEPSDARFGVSISIVVGQTLLWFTSGIILFFSIHEVIVLHRLGKVVRIDLYNIDSLNGFGRASLNGFLIIMGALALTFLQSINQTFVLEGYVNGFLVIFPAILVMVPTPVWSVHRRIQLAKQTLVREIDDKIAGASKSLEGDNLHQLNALMQRREQIYRMRNWPMDISISARFLMYVFIVPAAWAGAALMEVFLDSVLGIQ